MAGANYSYTTDARDLREGLRSLIGALERPRDYWREAGEYVRFIPALAGNTHHPLISLPTPSKTVS